MKYQIKATSSAKQHASILSKKSEIAFGITPELADEVPNPAELFLGSFAACILKNVERFSSLMKFAYSSADIIVNAKRSDSPPRMNTIVYDLIIYSTDERLNVDLLKKNIEKFGTIYNTIKLSCDIEGHIKILNSNRNNPEI